MILLLRPPLGPEGPDTGTTRAASPVPSPVGPGLASLEVLFIARAEAVEDPWSGHIAFPGGRHEPRDEDLRRTALRELREETELDLATGDLLGELDRVRPRSRHLPAIAVTPFVGWLPRPAEIVGNVEVTGHFWAPIDALLDPGRRSILRRRRGAALRVFPTIEYQDRTIWGLTYAVLRDFLHRIGGCAPGGPEPRG